MASDSQFRLPTSTQRIAIVGRTGSGKTIAGLWHLSNANFDVMPWVIIDYKTDEHIGKIERAQYIDSSYTPKNPGIYVIQPEPDDENMREFLTRIWQREGTGVYLDEGYMIGENKKVEQRFKTLLTQGRSKHIPMIVLSQRPVWISRFVWSESDFYQVFDIAMEDDIDTIQRMLPRVVFDVCLIFIAFIMMSVNVVSLIFRPFRARMKFWTASIHGSNQSGENSKVRVLAIF